MTLEAPTGLPLSVGALQLEPQMSLCFDWHRGVQGWFFFADNNDDIAFALTSEKDTSTLKAGARKSGKWDVWKSFDFKNDGPEGSGASAALKVVLTLASEEIELRLGDDAPFKFQRPPALNGSLRLHFGGFTEVQRQMSVEASAYLSEARRLESTGEDLSGTLINDLIFDLGMHIGRDTEYYIKKGFRVVSVEANPVLAALGIDSFCKEIQAGRLHILNLGIARERGNFTFYVNKSNSEWSSFDRDTASRGHPIEEISVNTVRISDIISKFGVPYYMKIDIEAYDQYVIEGLLHQNPLPQYISIENGSMHAFEKLVSMGYSLFKMVDQSLIPGSKSPSPAREGLNIDHVFSRSSSGPFGEDTPGAWSGVTRMRYTLQRHHHKRATSAPDNKWWDLHAKREPIRKN